MAQTAYEQKETGNFRNGAADAAALGSLQLQLEQLKAELPARVVSAVTLATA
jgi:hypothetical protein